MEAAHALARSHAQALGYPEAYEELPWGHPAIKVRKKVFVFCSALSSDEPTLSVKLGPSRDAALAHPGVTPMGYGLGKYGWCTLSDLAAVPIETLLDYIDESYRAVAPKTLVRTLGAARPSPRAPGLPVDEPTDALPRVLVVSAGPRRRSRAVDALIAAGVPAAGASLDEALDAAGELQPEAVLVDVGREAQRSLGLVADLAAVCPDTHRFVAGVRAGTPAPEGVSATVEPPGDPQTVALVIGRLDLD